jgi:AcrR family transcriptional regulator
MATQAERRDATRGRLIEAAEALFVKQGYEATSTDQILERAQTSRGALYHHFPNKRELFEAVFTRVSDRALAAAAQGVDPAAAPLEGLIATGLAWLREAGRPEVAAILIDQGPVVLGWKRARDLEAQTSLGLMTQALTRAIAAGELEVPSVPIAARLLNAALAEGALAALHDGLDQAEIEASIRHWIRGLASG